MSSVIQSLNSPFFVIRLRKCRERERDCLIAEEFYDDTVEFSGRDSSSWKYIYIMKRIIIIMGKQLPKKEINELYKEALHQHLLREDNYDYLVEVKTKRRIAQLEEF